MSTPEQAVVTVIRAGLHERELDFEEERPGQFFVTLPGTKKLQTNCWVVVGEHAVTLEAFVCRQPDENHRGVYHFLLRRNSRLYGVHYTLDAAGDIFLIGRVAKQALADAESGEAELDRLLGQVLEAADGDFNQLLELGFAEAIRREWRWRLDRGESTGNLRQFQNLAPESASGPAPGT